MKRINMLTLLISVLISSCSIAEPIRVMIIDGGVDATHPLLSRIKHIKHFSNEKLPPTRLNNHGTHVAGLVIYGPMKHEADKSDELCKDIEVVSCQIFIDNDNDAVEKEISCLEYAVNNNIKYINLSFGGSSPLNEERELLAKLSNNGTKIVAAAGNEGSNIDTNPYYPASFHKQIRNIFTIGNIEDNGRWSSTSNYGNGVIKVKGVDLLSTVPAGYDKLSGTSMSAAAYTHKLLKEECAAIANKHNYKTGRKQWGI